MLISTNPAKNYKKIGSVKISSIKEIKRKVRLANKAKAEWKELSAKKRAQLLSPLYYEYKKRKKKFALLTTKEMGKPISESLSGIDWDLIYFKDFLENGPLYLKDEITFKDKKTLHKIVFEPIGTSAIIVPWNFPFNNFLMSVIPNLIAGNTVVFKHSEECPLMGKLIDKMMAKLNLPKGVFSQVYGDGKVGAALVRQKIDFIFSTYSFSFVLLINMYSLIAIL